MKSMVKMFGKPKWAAVFLKLADAIGVDGPLQMMDQLKCDSVYEDVAVSSARWHGVRGVGSELVR